MTDSAAALLGDNGAPAAPAAGVQPTAQPSANSVWTAAFDEDTNAYVSNKGWKEPSDLLMSYRNLEKFAGGAKNLLELPSSVGQRTPTSTASRCPRAAVPRWSSGSRAQRTSTD